jgi:hypothetical protein
VAYDRAAGTVRWLVNDAEAALVGKIGFPAPDATTIIDHGGTPEVVTPRQLNCGMAMFTLLDGGLAPSRTGLVSLVPPYIFPARFAGGPNLFGQVPKCTSSASRSRAARKTDAETCPGRRG